MIDSIFRKLTGRTYKSANRLDFIHIAKSGLKITALQRVKDYFGLSIERMANLMHITAPTLYRWLKDERNLEQYEAVKLMELTDVLLEGEAVFESKENFLKWLELPNASLGGMLPIELLAMPEGISKLRSTLGRIAHGVYS